MRRKPPVALLLRARRRLIEKLELWKNKHAIDGAVTLIGEIRRFTDAHHRHLAAVFMNDGGGEAERGGPHCRQPVKLQHVIAIFFVVTLDQIVKPELALFWKLVMVSCRRSQLKGARRQIGFKGLDTAEMRDDVEIGRVKAMRLSAESRNTVCPNNFEQCRPRQCPTVSCMYRPLIIRVKDHAGPVSVN